MALLILGLILFLGIHTFTTLRGARAAVIGIEGFDGTWLVPAGVPGGDAPGFPTATGVFRLAEDFEPGPFLMQIAAADETGGVERERLVFEPVRAGARPQRQAGKPREDLVRRAAAVPRVRRVIAHD